MAEFEIPVEDFDALKSMVEAGNYAAAEKLFRKLTKVSRKDAQFFVEELAAESSGAQSLDEVRDVPAPEPVYTSIPLPVSRPRPAATTSRLANSMEASAETMPLPVDSKRVPAVSRRQMEPSTKLSQSATGFSDSAPVKPPVMKAVRDSPLPDLATDADIGTKVVPSVAGKLRWYERLLQLSSLPLLWGGLVGGLFCALALTATSVILNSSRMHRAGRCVCAMVALAGGYGGYLAVVGEVPRQFSLLGIDWHSTRPVVPIEPSSTHDWKSAARSKSPGPHSDSGRMPFSRLLYRTPEAFPDVSSVISESMLSVVTEDRIVDGASVGVPLLEQKQDLVADFGQGSTVTLLQYVVHFPWAEPGNSQEYLAVEDLTSAAKESAPELDIVRPHELPLLRCNFRFDRASSDELEFHLLDARSGRKVSSARGVDDGVVDFPLTIWHQTPLILLVEADAWTSSSTWRRPLPVGENFSLGMGRAQVAYVGPGRLDGIANGATIESGKPYRLVEAHNGRSGGMVIIRYDPPYLAPSTTLLLESTSDHLVSAIPAFSDFKFKPAGPDGDRLGFRVFHIPPTINDQLLGQGLLPGRKTANSKDDAPVVERAVNFDSDRLSVMFETQRGRGLIAIDEVDGMLPLPENGNLFDLEIPQIAFQKNESLRRLLQFAADAVLFDLDLGEAGGKGKSKLPEFREAAEYQNLTPRQALLKFEQLAGIRVVVDSQERRIMLQR